jgi:glycosyltransferase involved in cell wall biosynthesis
MAPMSGADLRCADGQGFASDAAMKADVLIDATSLGGLSGLRGIGRYIRDLLLGLSQIADTEAPDLRFSVITQIGPTKLTLTRDLPGAVEESVRVRPRYPWTLRHRRRLFLAPLAAAEGAALLHIAELVGTPLTHPLPTLGTCYDLIPLRFPRHYLGASAIADWSPHASAAWQVRRAKDARRYRSVDRIVCISEHTRKDLLDLIGISPSKVDVVQTGVELARYTEKPAEASEARVHERPFVLYLGHLDWRKNIGGMFDAVRIANERTPVDFLWAGVLDGPDRAAMEALAAARGVTPFVRFLGFVPDDELMRLYRQAVALLFLSRLEGFGLPVVEAMAAGCPVIVARNSAADEVVGDAGYVVSPDHPAEAAAKIVDLVQIPDERHRFADRARRRAALYNAPTMARGYLESYRKTLEKSRR